MKIDLTEILAKVGKEANLEEIEEKSYPEDDLSLTKPIKMKLHLINTGGLVILEGKVETEAEIECSRCLNRFRLPLSVAIKEEFSQDAASPPTYKKGAEIELHEEDFVSPIEKDNTIDISEIIRQNLLLALPLKALCNNNCQGLKE